MDINQRSFKSNLVTELDGKPLWEADKRTEVPRTADTAQSTCLSLLSTAVSCSFYHQRTTWEGKGLFHLQVTTCKLGKLWQEPGGRTTEGGYVFACSLLSQPLYTTQDHHLSRDGTVQWAGPPTSITSQETFHRLACRPI